LYYKARKVITKFELLSLINFPFTFWDISEFKFYSYDKITKTGDSHSPLTETLPLWEHSEVII